MGDTPSRDERQYQGRVIGGATLGRPVDNSSLQGGSIIFQVFWLNRMTDTSRCILGSNFPYHIHHPQSFQEHSHDGETAYPSSQRRGYPGPGQVSSEGAMDMSTLAGALPSYPPSGQIYGTNHPGFQSSGASVGLNPQLQNVASFAGQTPIQSPPFNIAFQSPFGPGSSAQQGVLHSQQVHHQHPGQHQGGPGLIQPPYANQSFYGNTHQHQHQQASQQQQQQFMYYPAPFGQISPSHQQFQGRDNPLFQAAQRRPSEQSLIDIKESGGLTWTAGAQHGVLPYPTPISPGQPGLGPYLRSGSVPGKFLRYYLDWSTSSPFCGLRAYTVNSWRKSTEFGYGDWRYTFRTTWASSKAKTVWSCFVGRKSTTWGANIRPKGSLFKGRYKRH